MAMPNIVTLWSDYGRQAQLSVVLKPSFNVDKKTDVAAAVMGATLRLEAPTDANQQPMDLPWTDFVELRENAPGVVTRVWRGGAEPFLVTQDARDARAMEFTFRAPRETLNIVAGRWNASLTVRRLSQNTLVRSFCINIPDDAAEALDHGLKTGDGSQLQFLYDLNELRVQPPPKRTILGRARDACRI
jgi:hypothetical protein